MKISTEIGSLAKLVGEERAIELVAGAGFDAWDFSMFAMAKLEKGTSHVLVNDHPLQSASYAEYAKRLGRIASDCGIVCNQSHAPFPTRGREILYYVKRAIECTAIVGGDVCVVHPDTTKTMEENTELYAELLEFAKGYGVRIATENMWDWNRELDQASRTACSHHDDFKAQLTSLCDSSFVACLDIGHAAMKGLGTSVRDMILTLGDDLAALHVHDNDGWHDLHALPSTGCIDFDEMLSCLHQIGYRGYLTLEADRHAKGFTAETASDCAKELAAAARRLADRFEAL